MSDARSLIALAAALVLIAPASAWAAGQGGDPAWFLISVEASGSGSADYGRDRFEPDTNHNASVGVDGTTSLTWNWRLRAVGASLNSGPVHSTVANFSGSATQAYDVLTWSWMNGTMTETPQCVNGPAGYAWSQHPGAEGMDPDWLGGNPSVSLTGRGFKIYSGYDVRQAGNSPSCLHTLPPHGLALFELIQPADAPVERDAFDPSSSRTFRRAYGDDVAVGTDHSSSDLNAAHTAVGSSRLEVKVDPVGARKAARKDARYSLPLSGGMGFCFPGDC